MSLQAVARGCRVRRSLFEDHVLAPILAAGLQKKLALQQARQVHTLHKQQAKALVYVNVLYDVPSAYRVQVWCPTQTLMLCTVPEVHTPRH